jgi:hypothetical protein
MECALREHAVIIGTTGRITLEPAHAPTQLTVITDQGIDGYPGAEEKAEAEEENNRTAPRLKRLPIIFMGLSTIIVPSLAGQTA